MPEDLWPEVSKVVQVNRDLLKNLPAFTCLETIERAKAKKNKESKQKNQKVRIQDVLQVQVGIGGGHEVFSWPGQNNFSDRRLDQIVGHGLIATGLFESFAKNLFVGGAGIIKFVGLDSFHSQASYHFSFRIPSLQNHWEVNWLGARGLVGEEGEFWVDVKRFTLLRLEVNAFDVPATLPVKHIQITIDYKPAFVGKGETLLPESALVVATEWNGIVHRDQAVFSHCRVFGAESTLSFSATSLAEQVSEFRKNREFLPAGLTFAAHAGNAARFGNCQDR